MRWFVSFTSCCWVQTDQRLSRSRNSSNETNPFAPVGLSLVNQFLNAPGGDVQILCASVKPSNSFDRMLRIQGTGSFDNRGRRMVRSAGPNFCVYRGAADRAKCGIQRAAKARRIDNDRPVKL